MTREVRLATATEDELMGLDVDAVERRLSSCRRAKARLGGYEATLVRVLGLLRERARADRSDDVEPEPGPDPAAGCGEEPEEPDQPAPEPSRREQKTKKRRRARGRTAGRISPDLRSASQRRADALTHLLLDPRPGKSGGAHLILDASGPSGSVSARTLAGDPVPIVEWFDHFDRGAELYLWLLDTDHRSLDLGRTSRHADDYQRMAMALRDGGCVWKHCDRAAAARDAHHLVEWEAMGSTDLASMALLCPHHHHRLHDMRCRLEPGTSPGDWNLVQTNTRQTIDTWTNHKALAARPDAATRLRQSTETSQGLRLLA